MLDYNKIIAVLVVALLFLMVCVKFKSKKNNDLVVCYLKFDYYQVRIFESSCFLTSDSFMFLNAHSKKLYALWHLSLELMAVQENNTRSITLCLSPKSRKWFSISGNEKPAISSIQLNCVNRQFRKHLKFRRRGLDSFSQKALQMSTYERNKKKQLLIHAYLENSQKLKTYFQ